MTLSKATQYWGGGLVIKIPLHPSKCRLAPTEKNLPLHSQSPAVSTPCRADLYCSRCYICRLYSDIIYSSTIYNSPHKAVTNPIKLLSTILTLTLRKVATIPGPQAEKIPSG